MRELHTIIRGKITTPQDLGLRQGTFIEILDICGQFPLFANPFGGYSSSSLEVLIDQIKNKENTKELNPLTLQRAIQAIKHIQNTINRNAENGLDNPLIREY